MKWKFYTDGNLYVQITTNAVKEQRRAVASEGITHPALLAAIAGPEKCSMKGEPEKRGENNLSR